MSPTHRSPWKGRAAVALVLLTVLATASPAASQLGTPYDATIDSVATLAHHTAPRPGTAYAPVVHVTGDGAGVALSLGRDATSVVPRASAGGVTVAGAGTADNPYVIQRVSTHEIVIRDTDAHLVVRDAWVFNSGYYPIWQGVVVENASNVTLERVEVALLMPGISVEGGHNVTLRDNHVHRSLKQGIRVHGARDAVVEGNTAHGDHHGVAVLSSPGVVVRNNTATSIRYYDAVEVSGSPGALVEGNHVTRAARHGLALSSSPGSLVRGNVVENATLSLYNSPGAVATGNTLVRGGFSVWCWEAPACHVDVDATNTAGGAPVTFLWSPVNVTLTGAFGQVIVANGTNVTLDGVAVATSGIGVQAIHTAGLHVANSTVTTDASQALRVAYGRGLEVVDSAFHAPVGIYLMEVEAGPLVARNTFVSTDFGHTLLRTYDATFVDNAFTGAASSIRPARGATFVGNELGSGLDISPGALAWGGVHVGPGNTVDGRPLHYLRDVSDLHLEGAGQLLAYNVSNVTVEGAQFNGLPFAAILLKAHNVTVRDARFQGGGTGLHGELTRDVDVVNATFTGVLRPVVVRDTDRARLEDVTISHPPGATFYDNPYRGVNIREGAGHALTGVRVTGYPAALSITNVHGVTVTGSHLAGETRAVLLNQVTDADVTGNTLWGVDQWGVGIGLWSVADVRVTGNNITDADYGVYLRSSDASTVAVTDNNIHGNVHGVVNNGENSLDATMNWWGCPQGPDHAAGCDDAHGDVTVAPWRDAPNPHAGAGAADAS